MNECILNFQNKKQWQELQVLIYQTTKEEKLA
jgi:hypothetical protein